MEEQKLWHSHVHEVKSEELIAPGVPDIAEKEVMKDIIQTYDKTFHSESFVACERRTEWFLLAWQVDRGDVLPLSVPQLMMAFVEDLCRQRDEYYKISSNKKREQRADLEVGGTDVGYD